MREIRCRWKFLIILLTGLIAMAGFSMIAFAGETDGSADGTGQVTDEDVQVLEEKLLVDGDSDAELSDLEDVEYNGFLYALRDETPRKQINRMEKNIDGSDTVEVVWEDQIYRAESLEDIAGVVDPAAVEYVEPDYVIRLNDQTESAMGETSLWNDPYYTDNEWAYTAMGVQSVWNAAIRGSGQCVNKTPTVAVMDSGIAGWTNEAQRHEDLDYENMPEALYANTNDNDIDIYSADDGNGHGTFVTGQIAAIAGNSKGVTGLMPEVNIIPARTLDNDGEGYISDSISMMQTLVKRGDVDVVNMSFGSEYDDYSFQSACQFAAEKGILLIAAAGNEGYARTGGDYRYPASYDGVISVASTDSGNTVSYYSQHNDKVDVAAPGRDIAGLGGYIGEQFDPSDTSGYCTMSGTSMSAPMVSALAAMVKSIDPEIDHDAFLDLMKKTSTDAGDKGYDNYFGWGIVNFGAVYQALANPHKSLTHVDALTATETDNGNIEYWYCSDCEKYFSNSECTSEISAENIVIEATGPKHGHELREVSAVEATCTKAGNLAYWYCDKCDKCFSDKPGRKEIKLADVTLGALGHVMTAHKKVDATCTATGTEAYWTCSRDCCKNVYFLKEDGSEQTTGAGDLVIAAGHKWNTGKWVFDETNHWHACTNCTEKSDVAKHSGGTATCSAKAKCDVCGAEYGGYADHDYGTWTKLNDQQHQRVCRNNAAHTETKNHTWDNGNTVGNVKTYTCTTCGATKTEEISPSGGGTGAGSGGSSGGSSGGGSGGGAGGGTVTVPDQQAENQAAADAVINAIAAIPAETSLEDEAAVIAARAAYKALTEDQKALVPDDTLQTLEQAEVTITNWKAYYSDVDAAKSIETKVVKLKNSKGKKLTVSWKRLGLDAGNTGYLVRYSTDRHFKKGVKTKTVKGSTKTKLTLKHLKKGKTYYVTICTYTEVSNNVTDTEETICGEWTKVKKVKIKK